MKVIKINKLLLLEDFLYLALSIHAVKWSRFQIEVLLIMFWQGKFLTKNRYNK